MTVAEYLAAEIAKRSGVVFSLTGGLIMHVTDAIALAKIKQVFHHHEQAACFAADAYARQSGRLGVCVVTGGPGGTNTVTGILSAWQDSTPLLVIAGQCKSSRMIKGTGQRQVGSIACDLVPIVYSITKFAMTLKAENSKVDINETIMTALEGRPGPVLLEVPLDVQGVELS